MKISVVGLRGFPNVQGGIETHCEALYSHLAKTSLSITIYGRKKYRVKDSDKVRMIWLPCFYSQYFETISYMIFCVLHIFFNKKPNIVHIHGIGPALFSPLFRLMGIKVILTYHTADYERKKWGFFAKKVLKTGEYIGFKFANKIIALSEGSKSRLASLFLSFAEKIVVIPNGIELPLQKNNARGKFILGMGRFEDGKGFDDLLDALHFVEATSVGCQVDAIIAGKPDHENAYSRNLVKKRKSYVKFPGFVQGEAKEKLFLECGLFVTPSHHEGLPFVLLEAMSYGCRILASDIPAHKELGLPDECYFPCRNIGALAEKIEKFYLYQSDPVNYDEMLKERYNWEKIAKRTFDLYENIL